MPLIATAQGLDFEFKDDGVTQQQIDDTIEDFFAQQQATQPQQQQAPITPPPNPLQQALGGALDPLLTIGTGIGAEFAGGLTFLGSLPFVGTDKALENVRRVKEALTFQPRTEAGKESLQAIGEFIAPVIEPFQRGSEALGEFGFKKGGPGLGTALQVAPLAALEFVGLGGLRKLRGAKKVSGISDDLARNLEEQNINIDDLDDAQLGEIQQLEVTRAEEASKLLTPEATLVTEQAIQASKPVTPAGKQIGEIKAGQTPEGREFSDIVDDLKEKRTKRVAQQVLPDEEIQRAADDLGIDLNPDHYSTNKAFQEVVQSLKAATPGSKLFAVEQAAIESLGVRANSLIDEIGGFTDKSAFDDVLKADFDNNITALLDKADDVYKIVNEAIPSAVRVEANSSKIFIQSTLDKLGGDKSSLTTAEKKLFKIINNPNNPTYFMLDRIRKDVGDGFKSKGPYKDDGIGNLKQVYRVLSEDQQGVADLYNVGEEYATARKLVSTRKDIEDASIELFGRDIKSSVVPKLKTAAVALTKGDVSKFNNLINAMPKARRAEAAATLLDSFFTLGARTKPGFSQGFVNAFEGLNKNKLAKDMIFSHLPAHARKTFDDIGRVTKGIFSSKAFENAARTGVARNLVDAMDNGSLIGKIFARTATGLGSVPVLSRIPGARFTAIAILEFAKKIPKPTAIAIELITSKGFREAIEESLKGNDIIADTIIKKSPKFKKWAKSVSPSDLEEIAVVGFIPWLTNPREEEL